MRMWKVAPSLLCRNHLLGEHLEMHMFKGAITKGKNIDGFLLNHLVDLGDIKNRHDELALEMARRGYHHNSPLEEFDETGGKVMVNTVSIKDNLEELKKRCKKCRENIIKYEQRKV